MCIRDSIIPHHVRRTVAARNMAVVVAPSQSVAIVKAATSDLSADAHKVTSGALVRVKNGKVFEKRQND